MDDVNFYEILGLDPDTVHPRTDPDVIAEAIKARRQEWNRQRTTETRLQVKRQAQKYLNEVLPKLETATAAELEQHQRECLQRRRERRETAETELKEFVELEGGVLDEADVARFVASQDVLSEADVRACLAREDVHVVPTGSVDGTETPALPFYDEKAFSPIVRDLEIAGRRDLYEFLEKDGRVADVAGANLSRIQAAGEQARNRVRHLPRTEPLYTELNNLARACEKVFADDDSRRRYDNSSEYHRVRQLLERRIVRHRDGGVVPPPVRVKCREIALQAGFRPDVVDAYLAAECDVPALSEEDRKRLDTALDQAREALREDDLATARAALSDARTIRADRDDVRELGDRVAAREELLAAVDELDAAVAADVDERGIAAAWQRVQAAGGHARANPHRVRASRAERRVQAFETLSDLRAEDEEHDRRLLAEWTSELEDATDPAFEPLRQRHAAALRRTTTLDLLSKVVACVDESETGADDREIVEIGAELLGTKYDFQLRPRVELAEVVSRSPSFGELAAAWERFQSERSARGLRLPNRNTVRVCEEAVRRQAAHRLLDEAADVPTEEIDRRIVAAWNGLQPAGSEARQVEAARKRVAAVETLRQAVREADAGAGTESSVVEAARAIGDEYAPELGNRVALARAMATEASEGAIADAWEAVENAPCAPHGEATVERCRLAVARRNLMDQLDALEGDPDARDAECVRLWDDSLMTGACDGEPYRRRFEEARRRTRRVGERDRAWRKLLAALDAMPVDDEAVHRMAQNALLRDHPQYPSRRAEIEAAVRRWGAVADLLEALADGRETVFHRAFDPELVRRHPDRFAPYAKELNAFLRPRLAGAVGPASDDPCSIRDGLLRVRWNGDPSSSLVRAYEVGVDPDGFPDDPEQLPSERRVQVAEEHRLGHGGCLLPAHRWPQVYVSVWPIVELGRIVVRGAPLRMGPVTPEAATVEATPRRHGLWRWLTRRDGLWRWLNG